MGGVCVCVCVYLLFKGRQVGVDGDTAEVIDEGKVLRNICRCPGVKEAVENPLISTCRHKR